MSIRRHRGRLGLLAATTALALAITACGGDAGNGDEGNGDNDTISGELTMLTPIYEGTEGNLLLEQEILPAFYELYPDVTVTVDYTTYGNLNEKLTTAVASGLIPDVMMMGVGWVEGFAANGVLADLDSLGVTADSLVGDYTRQIVEAGTIGGKLYALPIMLDTRFGCARMDILAEAGYEEPPSNWEELREYAIALTERDSSGTLQRAGFDMLTMDLRQMYEVFLFSAGGSLFDDGVTEPTFNSPEGVEALQFITDLMNEDEVEDVGFSSSSAEVHPLLNGRAAMAMCHNNLWGQIQEAAPELADQIQPFLIEHREPGMFFGGTLATVAANSSNPEAALALAQFLAGPEPSLLANEQRGNVPALVELLDRPYVQGNPLVQFAMENLDVARREGGPPQWLEIRGDFSPAVESALLQQKTPQQALDDLAEAARAAMAR